MPGSQTFLTHTLKHHPFGPALARVLEASIQAVEPGQAVRQFVRRSGTGLLMDGRQYNLQPDGRAVVVGLGKAAAAMAQSLVEILEDIPYQGLLIPKHVPHIQLSGFDIQPGGHPVPDENSLLAGKKAVELANSLTSSDLLICLISGGGSALMSAPHPGISLADLQTLTSSLLACGARIDEINTLRRRLDQVKGGGLARLASPARVVSLILSDVVNNPLETIASGPTAPDPASTSDALAVLERYGLVKQTPPAILHVLNHAPETPKPGDPLFARVQNILVGSNQLASQAGLAQAQTEGFTVRSLGNSWQGEARLVADELCKNLLHFDNDKPFCLVAGGETTVTVRGSGRGGRNQELALAAVESLAGNPHLLITLATDGEDGPTDAAGAVVSGKTLERGLALGLHPQEFLENNNAYAYFNQLDDLIHTGPTGTNVNDLTFLFGFP